MVLSSLELVLERDAATFPDAGVAKTLHCMFSIGVLRIVKLGAHITLRGELGNRSTINLHHL